MSKSKKTACVLLAVVMMAATLLSGCSGNSSATATPSAQATAAEPVVVTVAQSAEPSTLDPQKASADTGANVFRNICETLITYNINNELTPVLAENWEQVSENEWKVTLKQGISFSNGEPFNAEAVVYSITRSLDPNATRQSYELKSYFDHAEAADDYTVSIFTTIPDYRMPDHLTEIQIIAPAYCEEVGEEGMDQGPIGTGPYVLDSWTLGEQIVLVKNEAYWGTLGEVDKYIIRVIPETATQIAELVAGNVDLIINLNFEYVDALSSYDYLRTDYSLTRRTAYIAFNTLDWSANPQLKDVRVRQAMNYAINVDSIIENTLGGYAERLASFYREDMPYYDASITGYSYNPEKAKELLVEAGYPDGFEVTLMCNDSIALKATEVAQAVASDLAAVGIKCTVQPMEYQTYRSTIISAQKDQLASGIFVWSWTSKPHLIDSYFTGVVASSGMSSYNAIEGWDEMVAELIATPDNETRKDIILEIQKKLIEDPPFIYLYQQGLIYGINNRVEWNPGEHFYILANDMSVAG